MRNEVVYLVVVLAAVAAVVAYSGIPQYNFTGTYNVTGTAKPPPVETSPPSLMHFNATSEEVPKGLGLVRRNFVVNGYELSPIWRSHCSTIKN